MAGPGKIQLKETVSLLPKGQSRTRESQYAAVPINEQRMPQEEDSSVGTQEEDSSGGRCCGNLTGWWNKKGLTAHEEAALYVQEGESCDEFTIHPDGKWSYRAFRILHRTTYHVYHLCVCTLILLLALIERPSVATHADLPSNTLSTLVVIHALLEIILLMLIWLDIIFRFLWFRWKYFFTHRTLIIFVVLVVMSLEAIVVLAREENHFRITRALRIIFLLDTQIMADVRRVLYQIFKCIRPILDALILMMLVLVIFSLLGFLIFSETDEDYFITFSRSLVSLFITMTTANHPNVLMEAYVREPASPLFFVIYIIIAVYLVNNILLAVVYSAFRKEDKDKFKKLFLHKRNALFKAYEKLNDCKTDRSTEGIEFNDFLEFMHQYHRSVSVWKVMCIFKELHKDSNDENKLLSLEEFYRFYEVQDYKWSVVTGGEDLMWFENINKRDRKCETLAKSLRGLNIFVKSPFFNAAINIVVFINLITLVVYTLYITEEDMKDRYFKLNKKVAVSFVFIIIYVVEITLKIIASGGYYFKKTRNIADSLVILISLILLIVEASDPSYSYLAVFRPIKFFRLLRLKRTYRDIMRSFVILFNRLFSVSILLVLVYYFFAIIGLEFLNDSVKENCCNGSWYNVGVFYSGNNQTFTPNVYYLLDFDSILHSYLTLFVLMVVNNWYIIMEGFASTTENSWLVRLYFMVFFIITLFNYSLTVVCFNSLLTFVILQVIVSFMVDAFDTGMQLVEKERSILRGQYRLCKCDFNKPREKSRKYKEKKTVELKKLDIIKIRVLIWMNWPQQAFNDPFTLPINGGVTCSGRRRRTKDDIYLEMYKDELPVWIKEKTEQKLKKKAESIIVKLNNANVEEQTCIEKIKLKIKMAIANLKEAFRTTEDSSNKVKSRTEKFIDKCVEELPNEDSSNEAEVKPPTENFIDQCVKEIQNEDSSSKKIAEHSGKKHRCPCIEELNSYQEQKETHDKNIKSAVKLIDEFVKSEGNQETQKEVIKTAIKKLIVEERQTFTEKAKSAIIKFVFWWIELII